MTPILALQIAWVTPSGLSDDEFIEAAEAIGQGDLARYQVRRRDEFDAEFGRRH